MHAVIQNIVKVHVAIPHLCMMFFPLLLSCNAGILNIALPISHLTFNTVTVYGDKIVGNTFYRKQTTGK